MIDWESYTGTSGSFSWYTYIHCILETIVVSFPCIYIIMQLEFHSCTFKSYLFFLYRTWIQVEPSHREASGRACDG